MSRTDVPLRTILDKAERWIQDPDFAVPPSLLDRAAVDLNGYDTGKVAAHFSSTAEEYFREKSEALLAPRRPGALADFFRRVVRSLPERDQAATTQLGFLMPKLSPLLTQMELQHALDAVRRIDALGGNADDEQNKRSAIAASHMLSSVLYLLSSDQRAEFIMARPEQAIDILQLGSWLRPLASSTPSFSPPGVYL